MAQPYTLGILGMGRMGRCLAEGLIKQKSFATRSITYSTRQPRAVLDGSNWKLAKTNQELVKNSDVIVLAVKPQNLKEVLLEVGKYLGPG